MDRRFLTVLGVSLIFALIVSTIFYSMTSRSQPQARVEQVEMKDVVVAARQLPVGILIKPEDVKVVRLPSSQAKPGTFSKKEEVQDRPIFSTILADEVVQEGRLAPRGSGLGLAPTIPVGMRGVTVRVTDVAGVAGFVQPGLRVDVLVTVRPPSAEGSVTTTQLQNMLVIASGQAIQADKGGQAMNTPTVTLLATPEQSELLTLAGNQGSIQLILRNGSDTTIEKTPGSTFRQLYGGAAPRVAVMAPAPRPRVRVEAPAAAPLPPPPPPEVIMIRGNARTVERVGPSGTN